MRCDLLIAICFGVVVTTTAGAQTTTTATNTPAQDSPTQTTAHPTFQPTFVNLSGFSNDYQIGIGDLLEIQVVGQTDLNQTLRVSNAGEVSFPRLGLIPVADLTTFEAESSIADRFRDKGLIQQAEVLITVREYQAKPIYVSGAVPNPGEFIMSQELTLADAVLLAGGLQGNAADEGLLHRRISPEATSASVATVSANPTVATPGTEIIKVDLRPLKEGRFHEAAVPLKVGDVLVVPQAVMNAFFIVGEVLTPRNFSYRPTQTVMVSQAISWAGGPLPTAKMSDGMLVRVDEQGNRTEMKVDYQEILKGNQQDIALHPNDIIFIPGSKVKTITHALLGMTDQMVMAGTFRVARTYQLPDPSESVLTPPTMPPPPVR
jgi:polysaccharide export outer membrane protein